MLRMNQLVGFGAGSLALPAATFHALTQNGGSSSSYSFTNQAIGAEHETRCVVVAVFGFNATSLNVNSVTVAGVAATVGRAGGAGNLPVELWIARVPAGTTATIDVVLSAVSDWCSIAVWSATGIDSLTATDTAGDNQGELLIDVKSAGLIFCASSSIAGAGSTWTGATERFDLSVEGKGNSGADYTAGNVEEVNRAITCASADANELAIAVAWR